MAETAELLHPSMEQLLKEIMALNHAWKAARELFGENSSLSTSSRDLKTCLQVRLLRSYAPKQVYLVEDTEAEGERLYSLRLRELTDNRLDAAHLPVREANTVLSAEEIARFTKL